jgi:malate permease and related proteins
MNLFQAGAWQPLLQVVFLAGVGAACRLTGILKDSSISDLGKLVLMITFPVMLFVTGAQSDLVVLLRQGPVVLLAGIFVPLAGYAIGAAVSRGLRLPARQASVVRVTAACSNTAFVGIPLCTALWGLEGTLLAALFDLGLNAPLLTLPALDYGRSAKSVPWKQIVFSPMVWGLILGLLWNWLGPELPQWAATPLTALGSVTLPLSLVLVGAMAASSKVHVGQIRPLGALLASRLVLAPLAAWAITLIIGFHGTGAAVIVLQSAMPASVAATVMAKEYGGDADLASAGALLTVVLCLVTVPIMAALVGNG